MPLTPYQEELGRLLSKNRSEDSYLAGGAAILSAPHTERYSQDLDYFHDSVARVALAYEQDGRTLAGAGFAVTTEISQPGFLRALVSRGGEATKVDWAQDSTWRFMPVERSEVFGYRLSPIDLATNKVLALAGRNEVRDLIDTLHHHRHVLALGPLVWAATGKDPGFSPLSLLELLRRRGQVRPEELARLHLTRPFDAGEIKQAWLAALESADAFIKSRPFDEIGCLYYSPRLHAFVDPTQEPGALRHYGRPGGVLPLIGGS